MTKKPADEQFPEDALPAHSLSDTRSFDRHPLLRENDAKVVTARNA